LAASYCSPIGGERYAVVSCHVERPLDDRVWSAFARVQARRPGGFRIAALMRPPDASAGEREEPWLERARVAAAQGPFGHHTHFGGPETARPTDRGAAASRVLAEARRLRANGLAPGFFCGGGWYVDADVAEELAGLGYVDCSAVAFPLPWLGRGEPHLAAAAPCRIALPGGHELPELPTTHSLGGLLRSFRRLPPAFVHVHFHDWELVDPRRRAALTIALELLARRATVLDLETARDAFADSPVVPLRDVLVA
jgi:hypothetical protein